jgi:hypothetical protein
VRGFSPGATRDASDRTRLGKGGSGSRSKRVTQRSAKETSVKQGTALVPRPRVGGFGRLEGAAPVRAGTVGSAHGHARAVLQNGALTKPACIAASARSRSGGVERWNHTPSCTSA